MQERWTIGFVGGLIGGVLIAALQGTLWMICGPVPRFVAVYQHVLGPAPVWTASLIGGALFVLSGGLWGVLFVASISPSTVMKGILFGIAPAFWLFLVVAPLVLGQPIFFGFAAPRIILPLLFNCLVWGGMVGWYVRRHEERSAFLA